MMSKLLQTYYRAVQKRPILVQCCMTSSMWMIGDSLAQYLERQNTTNKSKGPKTHNYSRTLKMGLIGLCWNGPFSAWWLRFLDRKLGTATNSATVYKKLFFDQVCQNPVLTGGIIFLVGLSNNLTVEKSATVVQNNLLPVMYKGWVYWTIVQFANFKLVPLNYRLLVIQCASILWNGFLSWRSNMAIEEKDSEELKNIET